MGTTRLHLHEQNTISTAITNFCNYFGNELNVKLSAKSKKVNKLTGREKNSIFYNFRQSYFGFYKGKYIGIAHEPKRSPKLCNCIDRCFCYFDELCIVVHRSQFENYKEVVDCYIDVFGFEVTYILMVKGFYTRMDSWIDLHSHMKLIKRSLFYHRGRYFEEQLSLDRTIYLGKKREHGESSVKQFFRIYEKKSKSNKVDKVVKLNGQKNITVRIEVQHLYDRVPIRNPIQLNHLKRCKPFSSLRTYFCSNELITKYKSDGKTITQREKDFFKVVRDDGLSFARKKFNINRDFHKTIEVLLKKISVPMDLDRLWQKKMNEFIGDFDVRKYFSSLARKKRISLKELLARTCETNDIDILDSDLSWAKQEITPTQYAEKIRLREYRKGE